jgi:hypothetical protein
MEKEGGESEARGASYRESSSKGNIIPKNFPKLLYDTHPQVVLLVSLEVITNIHLSSFAS